MGFRSYYRQEPPRAVKFPLETMCTFCYGVQMRLREARKKFQELRTSARNIEVTTHAWRDHPERGFTVDEILALILHGTGTIYLNNSTEAVKDSFLFQCRDLLGKWCKFSVKFETQRNSEIILVINAYRKT